MHTYIHITLTNCFCEILLCVVCDTILYCVCKIVYLCRRMLETGWNISRSQPSSQRSLTTFVVQCVVFICCPVFGCRCISGCFGVVVLCAHFVCISCYGVLRLFELVLFCVLLELRVREV